MIQDVRRYCREQLANDRLDAVYGVREQGGSFVPCFFRSSDELDGLSIRGRHLLVYTCRPSDRNTVALVQEMKPGVRLGIVAKGCDERVLFELAKRFQLSLEGIEIIGVACEPQQAQQCRCGRPYPENLKFGAKSERVLEDPAYASFLAMSLEERFAFWEYHLSKCMKCYGCRNACPMCFCKDCQMERDVLARHGVIPPEIPLFHFIGVLHHADSCIDCGECEDACPMDIPLRLLRKTMRSAVKDLFGYEAGIDATHRSPLTMNQRGEMSHAADE